jgi:hypothetical protein
LAREATGLQAARPSQPRRAVSVSGQPIRPNGGLGLPAMVCDSRRPICIIGRSTNRAPFCLHPDNLQSDRFAACFFPRLALVSERLRLILVVVDQLLDTTITRRRSTCSCSVMQKDLAPPPGGFNALRTES